jgi:PAS domain S-box-containing protein
VALGGAATVAVRAADIAAWSLGDLRTWALLTLAIAAVEQVSIPLHHQTETENFSLTDGLWAAALMFAAPSILTPAVAVGVLLGQAVRRWASYKIAFNAGQFLLSIFAAELVYGALNPTRDVGPWAWAVTVVAMAAYLVVNVTTVALIIALVERKSFLGVVLGPLQLNVLHWAGNVAIGILGALAWATHPLAVVLVILPIVLSYFAYRSRLQSLWERDRMRNLYDAGRSLFGPLEGTLDFRPFLAAVRRMLEASDVELVLVHRDTVTVHHTDGVLSLSPDGPSGDRSGHAFVRVKGDLVPHVSTFGEEDGIRGFLAVYRERALSSAERSLLDTLAWQLQVKIQNQQLFREKEEQHTQLAEIFAHTSDGVLVVSPERVIQRWNQGMERITGVSEAEAVGRTWQEVLGTEDDPLCLSGEEGAPVHSQDLPVVRADGTPGWLHYTCNAIRDGDGKVKGAVIVARDVTADLELAQLKTDFVATISHELRTPLTPLKGFLSTLARGVLEESEADRLEYYRIMLKQTERLERLITDLLEVSRIESDHPPIDGREVDLVEVAEEPVQELARQHPHRRIELVAPEGPVHVLADPFRVQQILSNLLSNAIKYSPSSSPVEVGVSFRDQAAVVSVRDEGEGIALSEQDRIFERFQRGESGLVRETGGTGLGLYIAKRLVEAMSGRLWVVSRPGAGSTFSFSLPLVQLSAGELGRELGTAVRVPARD